ncbi:10918_t:CDS:2 [Cetraspora pellucida]|uniref:10918_t:CDS:1 n=1 Tax=Cetraspora pellucida TaxID=1433469 RepID=A0ACA9KAD8_9GLOM|nr:10918_t:CDS:2 [Cetraspora pellucida]
MHALFIRCRNLDDAKANGIIKKFLKILVPEIEEQNFDDAFLININIPAIREDSNDSNNFEKLLLDVVCVGVWTLSFYDPKNAQVVFFNLNNDLYMVNLNVLTVSG